MTCYRLELCTEMATLLLQFLYKFTLVFCYKRVVLQKPQSSILPISSNFAHQSAQIYLLITPSTSVSVCFTYTSMCSCCKQRFSDCAITVYALLHIVSQPENQQLIADAGDIAHLVALLKRHKDGKHSRAVNVVIRRAADAITNLAHENIRIKPHVRAEGSIPPLVELLEFSDTKVQRSAVGALRTIAFKNDENKNQVGVIGNLVHSSFNNKRDVLAAGALQPAIGLLSWCSTQWWGIYITEAP